MYDLNEPNSAQFNPTERFSVVRLLPYYYCYYVMLSIFFFSFLYNLVDGSFDLIFFLVNYPNAQL